MLTLLRRLPSSVWLIGLVSLMNDAASDLVYPLLPLYLTGVLLVSPTVLGFIEGLAEATSSLVKLVSGILSDRSRRSKPWIIWGYSLAALSRPLIALATAWPMVAALRFVDRLGKGLRSSPRDALLALSVAPEHKGLAFGVHRAMDNAGAVIGPLLAAVLLAYNVPIRHILFATLIPGLLVVLLTFALKEQPRPVSTQTLNFQSSLKQFPAAFRRYLGVLALFTMGNSSKMFLLLKARQMGIADMQIPLLWALTSGSAMIFSVPFSQLSDRWGRVHFISSGWLAFAAFYGYLAWGQFPLWMIWPLFALFGMFLAATEGVEKALVADLSPATGMGTGFGWFHLVTGLFLLPSSLLFGKIWQEWGEDAAFGFAALCALGAAFLLQFWVGVPRLARS